MKISRFGLMVAAFALGISRVTFAANGEDVFTARKCTVCHLVGEVGNKKGPPLDGVGSKLSPEEIRQWITNAPDMAAKANITRKPPMKAYTDFSKDDLDALVAYLATLKK